MRYALTAAAASAMVALSSAASALEVQTQVSTQHVSVGDTFIVQLTAMSDAAGGNQVSDVALPLPPGMTVGRPSVSPQSQVSIINGQMSQRVGVTVTWSVTTSKLGSFRVGPPSVTFAGERAQGQPIPVEVVAGSGVPQRARRGLDPFDFLNQLGANSPFPPGFNFKSPFDDDADQQQQQEPSYPDELRVDKAPDPIAFARATLTPDHVYVGQQVCVFTLMAAAGNTRSAICTSRRSRIFWRSTPPPISSRLIWCRSAARATSPASCVSCRSSPYMRGRCARAT